MIDVVEAQPLGAAAWDAYLRRHEGSLVYASSRFRALLVALLGCTDISLAAIEGGEIRGVMPLLASDGVLNSLPYYGSNGGVLADEPEAAAALIAAYNELARSVSTHAATVVENPFVPGDNRSLARTHGDERIAQWTDLPAQGIEASARRNVRKARDAGVVVERDPGELSALHAIHDQNIRALGGRPKSPRFFELAGELLEPERDFQLYVARREGRMIAGLLTLRFNRTVEYYTPAIDHDSRSLQPLAAILEVALAEAADSGFTRWNWGGTWESQSGVHRFKRKWGAREGRYRYHVQVNDASLLDSAPEALLDRFPGFYVAPFAALEPEGAAR